MSPRTLPEVAAAVGRRVRRLVTPRVRFASDIPVFVITRDRVAPLAELLSWLDVEGMTNVVIIDNDSTYPPLVDYLAATTHTVVQLGRNVGHTAPWDSGLVAELAAGRPFIVTDPDVIPDPEAHGAIERMCWLLNRHPDYVKVGLGLHIDDLPDHYAMKADVINWERQFWARPVPGGFFADVDTTFALHRPGTLYVPGPAMRTAAPFLARHEPWYMDSTNPPEEYLYYREHASGSRSWGATAQDTRATYSQPAGQLGADQVDEGRA